jgi:hypothetical protein
MERSRYIAAMSRAAVAAVLALVMLPRLVAAQPGEPPPHDPSEYPQPDPAQYPPPEYPQQYPQQPAPVQPAYGWPVRVEQVPVAHQETKWYGWKIALSDVAAIGAIMLADLGYDSTENGGPQGGKDVGLILVTLGAGAWWTLGTPILHLAEKNLPGAAQSVALRLGAPLIGVLIGAALDGPASTDDPHATAGFLIGVGLASVIDALVIANKKETRTSFVTPQLAVSDSGVRVGLSGSF